MAATHDNPLLLTLEEISQLLAHSHDAGETLSNIVRLVQKRCETDVCSVYLHEPERRELVLGATVGLNPDCIGRLRMSIDEGLTGLVAERLATVNVADAFQHPRFKYFPDAGEDKYHSFLGVPIVERGLLQGVLVTQTTSRRAFADDEARMLVTVASQLAPLISEAQLLARVDAASHMLNAPGRSQAPPVTRETTFRGVSLSPGRGRGVVYVTGFDLEEAVAAASASADPACEGPRLRAALDAARCELGRIVTRISELLGDDQGVILQGQLMILQDRRLEQELLDRVGHGLSAERAVRETLDRYSALFEQVTNPYFRERIYDIQDVFRRVIWSLRSPRRGMESDGTDGAGEAGLNRTNPATERVVLVARDASVMDLFSIEFERLAGIVVEHGGWQTHAAILARSLGIPMVGRIPADSPQFTAGVEIEVDGTAGSVTLFPGAEHAASEPVTPSAPLLCVLPDDAAKAYDEPTSPRVEANLNLPSEVRGAAAAAAAGIGLFRSEFLFLARRTLPSEAEQVRTYGRLLTAFQGRPVSIRTFDLRPDKLVHWSSGASEAGPFDWRLVLDCPPLQELFRDQVRAILQAAECGPARIVVPNVNTTEQLDFVVETVAAARDELLAAGWECARGVPLGVMLESAAAAQMVKTWAPQVDFFTMGTNDLVPSALGLGRDDAATQSLIEPLHPGVLRLIHAAVVAAHYAGKTITVCGEMAGDRLCALALAALRVDAVSVAVNRVGEIRELFREHAGVFGDRAATQLLGCRDAAAVRAALRSIRPAEAVPDDSPSQATAACESLA